jgi:hypothetical protein
MSTGEERLEQLRQAGYVDVEVWLWGHTVPAEYQQQDLLGVLHNDPETTVLK